MKAIILHTVLVLWTLQTLQTNAAEVDYDPLAVAKDDQSERLDLTVRDNRRGRDIPLRIYLPAVRTPSPVLLFSHGLGGSRENNAYLGEHWSARGYIAVFTQHPGSDVSVWKDKKLLQRMPAMKKAANAENFLLRVEDIHAVIDQLAQWNQDPDSPLNARMDLDKIGMSGHSFGALTTQAVSGQHFRAGILNAADPRIKAAVMFSPSSPRRENPEEAFAKVKIPWMLMTGTRDTSPIGNADLKSRLAVYPALPPGDKYELVLHNAEHSAFSDHRLPGDREKRNPNHHRVILALSTAFWDAVLQENAEAKAWLDGEGPRTLMEDGDRWQTK